MALVQKVLYFLSANIKVGLLLLSLALFLSEKADSQNCVNFIPGISLESSSTECVATSESSAYYGGVFNSDINISNHNLIHNGGVGSDVFLVKTDRQGQIEWTKSWGGKNVDHITSITVKNEIVYSAGYFNDTLYIENDTLFNNGQIAAFIIVYDTAGNYIKSFSPDAYNLNISKIDISLDNKLLITGQYYQYANLGGQSFLSQNGYNYFLFKYDLWSGQLDWFKESNGNNTKGKEIVQDSFGNIYICGIYGLNAMFEGNVLPNDNGNHNTFIAKYSSNGVLAWIKTIQGIGEVHGYGIDVTPEGQSFITGEFENSITSDSSPFLSSSGLYDVFIISFDASGNIVWGKSFGGFNNDIPRSLQLDMNNDPVILADAGGGFTIDNVDVSPNGSNEPLLVKLSKTDGEFINHCRVKSQSTSGVVQSKQFAMLDTMIFVVGKNFSSVECGANEYFAQNTNDSYLIVIEDYLTYIASINLNETTENYGVYPNPVTTHLNISFTKSGLHNIKLYDILGNLLIDKNAGGREVMLPLVECCEKGMYFLLMDGDFKNLKKIIIK